MPRRNGVLGYLEVAAGVLTTDLEGRNPSATEWVRLTITSWNVEAFDGIRRHLPSPRPR
jgi:hypothetical protein